MNGIRNIMIGSALVLMAGVLAAQSSQVNVQYGVPYAYAQYPGQDKAVNLCFDFYEPADSSDALRPLVITAFGGGFVLGSRDYEDMVEWCSRFAEIGCAAASIDYRLLPAKKFSSKELVRAGYMAAQDVSTAVRFFKANSEKYRIDTNRIFLLGQSAGAVAIIHALYMDEDERPSATREYPALPPLHSLGNAEEKAQSFSVAGAILLWGCVFDPEMMDADEITPVCLIHGEKDRILPVDSGYAFSIMGMPYAYGSRVMANRLKELGAVPFEVHLKEKETHAFYFKHLSMFQLDAMKFDDCFQIARDFILRNENE